MYRTYIHSQWYSGMGWSADRTKGTSCVGPSIPSGTGWKLSGGIQSVGRTEGTSNVYLFIPLVHWEVLNCQ